MKLTYQSGPAPATARQPTRSLLDRVPASPIAQLAAVDALFAVSDPVKLRAFSRLADPLQMERELRILEGEYGNAVASRDQLTRMANEFGQRVVTGSQMIAEQVDGAPQEWLDLLANLVASREQALASAEKQEAVIARAGGDYPIYLAVYEQALGLPPSPKSYT